LREWQILFRKNSPRCRSTSCVQISWNLADRKSVKSCVIYLTKKSARAPAVTSARIAPKICQGQLQTIYSNCPEFHPNPFTSGGVIAERVNVVQTRHKVFPILGEASASSPSNTYLLHYGCASITYKPKLYKLGCFVRICANQARREWKWGSYGWWECRISVAIWCDMSRERRVRAR